MIEMTLEMVKKVTKQYIHSDCQFLARVGDIDEKNEWMLLKYSESHYNRLGGRTDWMLLVLKRIADITEEHALQVNKIWGVDEKLPFNHKYLDQRSRCLAFFRGTMPFSAPTVLVGLGYLKLIEMGYDVPFHYDEKEKKFFTAIDLGVAVDVKDLDKMDMYENIR